MSLLTDAEQAYRAQRAAVQLVGPKALRRAYRRTERRARDGDQLALVRLAAVRDEYLRRGIAMGSGKLRASHGGTGHTPSGVAG